jgi:intracellular multiplication protein IcmB
MGCEYPLPLEKAFLQNFLALLTLPPEEKQAVRGHGANDLARDR